MGSRSVPAPFTGKRDENGMPLCPWCGVWAKQARGFWHPECVKVFRVANNSPDQRQVCWERDRGVCAACRTDTTKKMRCVPVRTAYGGYRPIHMACEVKFVGQIWHADHCLPIWLVDRTKADWLKYFGPSNLQTLCEPCHKAKTAKEAAERAKIKRITRTETKPKAKIRSAPAKRTNRMSSPSRHQPIVSFIKT